MSAEVYLDTVDLEAPGMEVVAVDPIRPEELKHYPLLNLRSSGRTELLTMRVAVLENPFLKATFNLDLGGRLWQLVDKRTGFEVLPLPTSIAPSIDDRALMLGGLLTVGGLRPSYGLSTVDQLIREPQDEGAPAALILHDIVPPEGIGWHLEVEIPADRPELLLKVRIANRSMMPAPYHTAWQLWLPESTPSLLADGAALHSAANRAGCACFFAPDAFHAEFDRGEMILARTGRKNLLPRETDAFSLKLVPWSGFDRLEAASPTGAVGWKGQDLILQVAEPVPEARLVLDLLGGTPVEATVALSPGEPLVIASDRLPGKVREIALIGSVGVLLRSTPETRPGNAPYSSPTRARLVEALAEEGTPESGYARASRSLSVGEFERRAYAVAGHVPGLEGVSRIGLARAAIEQGDLDEAADWVQEALEHNAKDPLAWWLAAAVERHREPTEEPRPELLNAHYLAPLEPALRIESFLGTPTTSREPSPLLRPYANHPDAFIEGACLLLEFGLTEDAARWIDEALRHRDLPILHYLLAWSLLANTPMLAEAARHLDAASRLPIAPPLPWRWVEAAILSELHERFPDDARLAEWTRLAHHRGRSLEGVR